MKYIYQYKLSGGERHSGMYEAPSKEAAYAELRKSGVKPFDVRLAPGVLNRIRSWGRRVYVIVALSCLLAVAIVLLLKAHRSKEIPNELGFYSSTSRHQVLGDEATVELGIRTGWSHVFEAQGDRFLASYAIPGCIGGCASAALSDVEECIGRSCMPADGDSVETRQIKLIVEGMKAEAREFVAAGGSVSRYCQRVVERQREEVMYYNRAQTEIGTAANGSDAQLLMVWRRCNGELKKMGIKTVRFPDGKAFPRQEPNARSVSERR